MLKKIQTRSIRFMIIVITIILFLSTIITMIPKSNYDSIPRSIDNLNQQHRTATLTNQYEQNHLDMRNYKTRSGRYLESIIDLDDDQIQLTVHSGNDEDNTDNSGNYPSGGALIATGDIDNDGFQDLILGSPYANGVDEGEETAGQVMVVFGREQTYPGTVYDQAAGKTDEIGMVIHGADGNALFNTGDRLGTCVASGDIDGDGYDDIVIGAPNGDSVNNQRRDAGEVYVIYGGERSQLSAEIDLASTAPGLMVQGANGGDWPNNPDLTGYCIAVGDVMGDSKDDIVIGAPGANGGSNADSGIIWVISGKTRFDQGSAKDLRTGAELVINGWDTAGFAGFELTTGDVNGDGRDDILIGAPYAELEDWRSNSGLIYIVYGKTTFSSGINLRSGADVVIKGSDSNDYYGWSLAVGNIDGDSYNDIIIGAPFGNGPNNGQTDAGEICVIYGKPTLDSTIDINNNDQDIIMYGKDGDDNFGFSIDIGKTNDDNYEDLIISARNGDGQFGNKGDSGEVYLILGNSSANLGSSFDIDSDASSKIYGVDINDGLGRTVRFCDFDADGYDDPAIAAPEGDGPIDSNRNNAGDYYLIFSQPPPMKNLNVTLVNGDVDGKTVLAKYKPYILQVNVTNILGYKDFSSVTLTIDSLGYNIKYRWDRSENRFYKINDPMEMVECLSVFTDARHDSQYTYSINFKFDFNWSFAKYYPIDCKVSSVGIRSLLSEMIYPNILKVNNRLNFVGTLHVSGAVQGTLKENDWVSGSEELTFSGLKVVYDGIDDHYPPTSVFSLGIEDNLNLTAISTPLPGAEIESKLNTPALSVDNEYNLRILDIPKTSDNSSNKIILRVDNDAPTPPSFIHCKADSSTIDTESFVDDDTEIFLSWDNAQDKGSGVSGYYYNLYDLSGTDNGFWTTKTYSDLNNCSEGVNNIYVWAKDAVGNIGHSSSSEIFIDLTEVTFENFTPSQNRWYTSENIDCTIEIVDRSGFGVDPENIWYWDIYGKKWVKVTDIEASGVFGYNISVTAHLVEGNKGFIKFYATDLAGNGPTESDEFYFKIDSTPVEFIDLRPDTNKKMASTYVKCKVTVQDLGGSGVNLSTIQYSYSTSGLASFSAWDDSGLAMLVESVDAEQSSTWIKDIKFNRNGENYIKWRAMDIAGNGWTESDPLMININLKPTIIVENIDPDSKYISNELIEFNAENTFDNDDHISDLEFSWRSNITGQLGKQRIINTKLPAGQHMITLTVYDGYNNSTKSFNITVKGPKKEEKYSGLFGFGELFDFLLMILILIIIILSIFLVLYKRERKKRHELEQRERAREITPEISYIPPRKQISGSGPVQYHPNILDAPAGTTNVYPGLPMEGTRSGVRAGLRTGVGIEKGTGSGTTQFQQLPSSQMHSTIAAGVGDTGYGQRETTRHVGSSATGTAGNIGPIPQLPPASGVTGRSGSGSESGSATATVTTKDMGTGPIGLEVALLHLEPAKKLELLEQKMLLGELPIELYIKLSAKYEAELRASQGVDITAKRQTGPQTMSSRTEIKVTPKENEMKKNVEEEM